MTNTELVYLVANMFADYISYMVPLIGLLAGIHLVLTWIFDITFRPFNRL